MDILRRVGGGYARKLEAHGIYTMGDVARCSLENEDLLSDFAEVQIRADSRRCCDAGSLQYIRNNLTRQFS